MFAIRFDSIRFTEIEELVNYICEEYGSLAQVPEDHPQLGIVDAIVILNPDAFIEYEGIAWGKYQ